MTPEEETPMPQMTRPDVTEALPSPRTVSGRRLVEYLYAQALADTDEYQAPQAKAAYRSAARTVEVALVNVENEAAATPTPAAKPQEGEPSTDTIEGWRSAYHELLEVARAEHREAVGIDAPSAGNEQRRCWTITNARTYGGEDTTAQCWLYNGHVGPHWFGGEDYADTVSRSLTGLPWAEARASAPAAEPQEGEQSDYDSTILNGYDAGPAEPQGIEPRTEAGRALMEWANNAYPGSDQLRIWRDHVLLIESQGRASARPNPEGSASPAAEPAVTEALRRPCGAIFGGDHKPCVRRLGHLGGHYWASDGVPEHFRQQDDADLAWLDRALAASPQSPETPEPTGSGYPTASPLDVER